jgi:hypothetical protein
MGPSELLEKVRNDGLSFLIRRHHPYDILEVSPEVWYDLHAYRRGLAEEMGD